MIRMKIGASMIPSAECDMEDVFEELDELEHMEGAFLILEDETNRIMTIGKSADEKYVIIAGNVEKQLDDNEKIKEIIENFFNGKMPDWVDEKEASVNYFPDGIDDILKWE